MCIFNKMLLPELSEISRLRKKFKITQTELAKKAGVSQSLIARLEMGRVDPRYSKVANVFRALNELKGREILAKELMTSGVVGVQTTDSMEETARIMKKRNVSQMPVFDKKKVVGSIWERIILDEIAKGRDMQDFSHRRVEEFMEQPFPIMSMDTPLTTISSLLEHNTAVLVMERGDIKGIITNANLLKVVHR
jgi:predicted transcriptional regulator